MPPQYPLGNSIGQESSDLFPSVLHSFPIFSRPKKKAREITPHLGGRRISSVTRLTNVEREGEEVKIDCVTRNTQCVLLRVSSRARRVKNNRTFHGTLLRDTCSWCVSKLLIDSVCTPPFTVPLPSVSSAAISYLFTHPLPFFLEARDSSKLGRSATRGTSNRGRKRER